MQPDRVFKVLTSWALRPPAGYYLRVVPCSGLGVKGIDPLAGVVDRGYSGKIFVLLTNHSGTVVPTAHGERIAQTIVKDLSR